MKALTRIIRGCRRLHPRVQILSDLHLEAGQQYRSYAFPAAALYLLLAGDVGRLADYDEYLAFLEGQVSRFDKVLLVLGNHEFYGADYETGLGRAQSLEREPSLAGRLVLLHRARWDDPDSGLTVLGCTLWSAISEDARAIVASNISDFKRITGWTTERHCEMHVQEATWLREQVAQAVSSGGGTRRLLVATHHAPCVKGTSSPEHIDWPWTSAFATDLMGQACWGGVQVWVFGHTHYSTDLRRNGVRVVANQRGYVFDNASQHDGGERKKTKRKKGPHEFDPCMTVSP